jgi:hypothetical protein
VLLSASEWKVPNSIVILQGNWNFDSSTCSALPNPIHDLKRSNGFMIRQRFMNRD